MVLLKKNQALQWKSENKKTTNLPPGLKDFSYYSYLWDTIVVFKASRGSKLFGSELRHERLPDLPEQSGRNSWHGICWNRLQSRHETEIMHLLIHSRWHDFWICKPSSLLLDLIKLLWVELDICKNLSTIVFDRRFLTSLEKAHN